MKVAIVNDPEAMNTSAPSEKLSIVEKTPKSALNTPF